MKKMILILLALVSLSASAEVILMNPRTPQKNELFIDDYGKYRYKRTEEMFKSECGDISVEEVRKKCLEAEKAKWERGKTKEEIGKDGKLFTGKIRIPTPTGKDTYFYVYQGKKDEQIKLELNRYYFENGVLYDIKTEEPVSDDIIIGGAEGLSSKKGNAPRFLIQQKYENGLSVGEPTIVPVK